MAILKGKATIKCDMNFNVNGVLIFYFRHCEFNSVQNLNKKCVVGNSYFIGSHLCAQRSTLFTGVVYLRERYME